MSEMYRVTEACYVPVGPVRDKRTQFKQVGQVVTLDKRSAEKLEGFIEPVDSAPAKKSGSAIGQATVRADLQVDKKSEAKKSEVKTEQGLRPVTATAPQAGDGG